MSEPTKAVFLSYAREDSAATQRLAEALRAFGVEVWFDREELRGGDSWDAEIRHRIKTCALFIPIVSAQTEARSEGYFRREWKLAVDRTHDMGAGRAFIVPVVIDATKEAGADAPEEFLRYQWIRLADGVPTPQFVEQVKRLLAAPRGGIAKPAGAPAAAASPVALPTKKPFPVGLVAALGLVVAVIAAGVYLFSRADAQSPAAASAPSSPVGPAKAAATEIAPPEVSAKSIAVLPFTNMSADKDSEFFADGVHEDLLTALAKVRDLKVISRTSVLGYRDTARRNLRQIASELGVAHVLEGSVRRAGGKARITVQLIDARTDQHLWAESYDRDITDIFAVQGEVAREITRELRATLTPSEQQLIGRQLTSDPVAYELYVNARSLQQELGESAPLAEYERLIALFEQVVARDPRFVLAYVQMAQTHSILYWFGTLDPTPARAAKMKAAVEIARGIAPDLPEVRLARGAYLYRVELDWNAALVEFRAAEAGLPNDAQLKFWLAITNRRLGRWQESLTFFEQSVAVNPRDRSAVQNWLGYLLTLRRYAALLEVLGRFKANNPAFGNVNDTGASARFALDGDRAAFARALGSQSPAGTEESRVSFALRIALAQGDLAAADRVLTATRATEVTEEDNRVISDPVAYHRAIIAAARGDAVSSQRFAAEAEHYYRGRSWTRRQEPWVRMRLAVCAALGGRGEEAIREANGALADAQKQDALATVTLRDQVGVTFLLAGRRDEALRVLREVMETPLGDSAAVYRADPLWSRLAGDPEFEAILRLEKSP